MYVKGSRKSLSTLLIIAVLLTAVIPALTVIPSSAATLTSSTTWVGNTFGGADDKWVQNFIWSMAVNSNGRVFTSSTWDEGHRECGIYENGDVIGNMHNYGDNPTGAAAAVNSTHAFAAKGDGAARYAFDGLYAGPTYNVGHSPTALAANSSYLIATDATDNAVKVYNVDSGSFVRSWTVNKPGAVAITSSNEIWVVSNITRMGEDSRKWEINTSTPAKILKYDINGNKQSAEIQLATDWIPTALAIDNHGRLMVGDNGPKRQIHFYNISGSPSLATSFGTAGGIGAGTPGIVTPTKFWGITGVGTDSSGNIYVSLSEHGSIIRKLQTDGTLIWEVKDLHFIDCADADPSSNGLDLYTKQEHFVMDYSKAAGQDSTFKAYTMDSLKYPQDPRMWLPNKDHHSAATFMRRLNGDKLYMATAGMYWESPFCIFRFNGEIAVPSVVFSIKKWTSGYTPNWPPNQPSSGAWIWRDADGQGDFDSSEYTTLGSDLVHTLGTWWIDTNGDVWHADGDKIGKFPVQGYDSYGNPMYNFTSMTTVTEPAPFNEIWRIEYYPSSDTMYLGGYTSSQPYDSSQWKAAGKVIARYDNWSTGNRTAKYSFNTPWDLNANPKVSTQSMAVAGDYIFTVGCETCVRTWVYKASDGSYVGELMPGSEVGGISKTGWVDIPNGIRAFKRSDGSYLVFVEEDYNGKVIIYKWSPPNSPTPTPTPAPSAKPIPGKIQAEDYTSMSGIQTEGCSDTDGGLNVGWVDTGDWMDYNVNVQSSGTYNVKFRVATPNSNTKIDLRNSSGTVLGTVTVPNTGGWQTWQDATISVNLTAGTQTLRVYGNTNGWNLNWFEFTATAKPIPGKIQAEDYTSMSGIQTESCSDTGGGLDVGWVDTGDWMDYGVNVQSSGTYNVKFRVASPNSNTKIDLKKSDGTVLGTVNVPNTGGWQTWQDATISVNLTAGTQTLRVYGNTNGWNLNWFEFTTAATPTPTPATETTVDDSSSSITYSGTWNAQTGWTGRYNNTEHESDSANAYAEYTFTGTQIKLIGEKVGYGGNADVYIDGTFQQNVSFNNSSQLFQQEIYTKTGLSSGSHTIKVVVKSGWCYIDAFKYK